MGQLEIVDVNEFLNKYQEELLDIMHIVQIENDVEYISINCMDILNGYTVILAIDKKTADLIEDTTKIKFDGIKARINELISRKEIVKVMRDLYKHGEL